MSIAKSVFTLATVLLVLFSAVTPLAAFEAETVSDDFSSRTAGSTDYDSLSPEGLSWSLLRGGILLNQSAFTANLPPELDVDGSDYLYWPPSNSSWDETLITIEQTAGWTQVDLTFDWGVHNLTEGAGPVLLYQDDDNYYRLHLNSGANPSYLYRAISGTETSLSPDSELAPYPVACPPQAETGGLTRYRFSARVYPTGVLFEVDKDADGTVEFTYNDADPAALDRFGAGGQAGFYFPNAPYRQAWVDNVSVTGGTPGITAASVTDLAAGPASGPGGYELSWTVPDADLDTDGLQDPDGYDIRYAVSAINSIGDFFNATPLNNIPDPWSAGETQTMEAYSLPTDQPLYFAILAYGSSGSGELSNSPSSTASGGSATWHTPANNKVGIDLQVAGTVGTHFVYETLFYDETIDDHGILYLKDFTELAFAHNAKNSKPFTEWQRHADELSIFPVSSAAADSLTTQGEIRYHLDGDGLRIRRYRLDTSTWVGEKQSLVVDGHVINPAQNRYVAHPLYSAYEGPFTPKQLYDRMVPEGYSTSDSRIGQVNGPTEDDQYHKGYTDPDTGAEWHELSYWDDDRAWLMAEGKGVNRQGMASDGRTVWVVVNPDFPVPEFSAGTGGQFFTTRPKAYYTPRIGQQTTCFSGAVTLTLHNLSRSAGPIQYQVGSNPWATYTGPIDLSTVSMADNTPVTLSLRLGVDGPVKTRVLVKNPARPSEGETHPTLLFTSAQTSEIWDRINAESDVRLIYNKLYNAYLSVVMDRDYEVEERIKLLNLAQPLIQASALYGLNGEGAIDGTSYTGAAVADKVFRTLLAVTSNYDSIGDESQAGQWSTPCGECCTEWFDRYIAWRDALVAYDLVAGYSGIGAIDELKLRENFAREAYLKMRFIYNLENNWNTNSSVALACAAYAMPSYDSPVFGGATTTAYPPSPDVAADTWQEYVETPMLDENQNYPYAFHSSSIWKGIYEDGMGKETGTYDPENRNNLTYFINFYANRYGRDLLAEFKPFELAFDWSLRTRRPWDRDYPSYAHMKSRCGYEDFHLLVQDRFANSLDVGAVRWHYDNHDPVLDINSSWVYSPYRLAWFDPTIPAVPPAETGSKAYLSSMVFQTDMTDPNTVQMWIKGRPFSELLGEGHTKDDSTSMYLNAFGERFLVNNDTSYGLIDQYPEAQNVILVDDGIDGPDNSSGATTYARRPGPTRYTVATVEDSLVTPYLDYGVMATQAGSTNDVGNPYYDKAQVNRHILFPDHRFFVVMDDVASLDGANHKYSWLGHCWVDDLVIQSGDARVVATKPSGNKVEFNFFAPLNITLRNFVLPTKMEYATTNTDVPYFAAETQASDTHFLMSMFPLQPGDGAPVYSAATTTHGSAGIVEFQDSDYLFFSQPEPLQSITVNLALETSARLGLAKFVGDDLQYAFFHGESGTVSWMGEDLLEIEPGDVTTFLYLPVDPATGGPSIYTSAGRWTP